MTSNNSKALTTSTIVPTNTLESAIDNDTTNSHNEIAKRLGLPIPTLWSLKTLESAIEPDNASTLQTNSSPPSAQSSSPKPAFVPPPFVRENASAKLLSVPKSPTTTITITDPTQTTATEWKEPPPSLQRQSSFAATRKEQTGSPVLLEQNGDWQVIKDGLGRTYFNNVLTRMTTWTDHTKDVNHGKRDVPAPHDGLYPAEEGFGVAKAKVTAPDTKPVLLEERGDWMAILAPTGHVYYHNKLSRMQTWSDPTAEVNDGEERRLLLDEKGNWQEILDVSGKVYYNNTLTRLQTWTPPREMLDGTGNK